jgi:transposase
VVRFNDQGADGLINIPSPGVPPKLNAMHKAFLARIVEEGPIPAIHGVVRWRACDLIMRLYEEFGLSVSDDTIYRALKKLGFSHVSARPKAYKQNAEAMQAFKKNFAGCVAEIRAALAPGTPLEVWFQDEMRDALGPLWPIEVAAGAGLPQSVILPHPALVGEVVGLDFGW